MKIIVLGHSNSILIDGWLSHLKARALEHTFVNLSVGGSPSPALLYQAAAHAEDFLGADLVIIEPKVIDHGEDWQTGAGVAGQANALISWLNANTCAKVLVLVLPRTPEWSRRPSQGMQAWWAAANHLGAATIDGRVAIQRYCLRQRCGLSDAWRDKMGHTVPGAQEQIALDVAEWINHCEPERVQMSVQHSTANKFRVISAAEMHVAGVSQVKNYRSSLLSVDCVCISCGSSIPVGSSEDEKIHGIAVNFGAFNPMNPVSLRAISVDGRSTIVKVKNPFLGVGPLGRLILMFSPAQVNHDVDSIQIDESESDRFALGSEESVEISGILVGPPIAPIANWSLGAGGLPEMLDL